MSKIAFFCIPAYGHTNPTLEVVRELTRRGHQVWYFSFDRFKDLIEAAGATYISCDGEDDHMNMKPEDAQGGFGCGLSIRLLVDSTLSMDKFVTESLKEIQPDCVVADSMAVWGKFAAMKMNILLISSTTTFAFNRYSAKIMKQSFSQMMGMLLAMPRINREVKRMQENGYPIKNFLSLISNDESTPTIVYTSKEFQPCADTFSDKYCFAGPSIRKGGEPLSKPEGQTVYISMGTVNNRMTGFYQHCIEALKDSGYHVIMSVGEELDIASLSPLPDNFTVKPSVDQIEVLKIADVFLSHCGMNSVTESLYNLVPLVLYPQTAEQSGVARRVFDLKAGIYLKENSSQAIRKAVQDALSNPEYKRNAAVIARSFKEAGGASAAADAVLKIIEEAK